MAETASGIAAVPGALETGGAQPQVVDNGGCTPELFSKWYYRILRFGSMGAALALGLCSIAGFGSDMLALGAKGVFFQYVFALVGLIWALLLFAAEFSYLKFRKYFGFLRKRLGRAIMHCLLGTLCILFGNQNTSVIIVLLVGCVMVFLGLMHLGALFPCVIQEIQSDDPAQMTREQYHAQVQPLSVV